MNSAILYIHGKGGSAKEADRFRAICTGFDVLGVDYKGEFPWEAAPQIAAAYDEANRQYEHIILLANSIGAYFSMLALGEQKPDKALFVSPVLDMERLILDMMGWAGVSEQMLREKGEIPTNFGETLSWKYLRYVREHPIAWQVPTEILYAGGDHLVSRQTVERFAAEHGAGLTVLENGEHWFHTEEQLAYLDNWVKRVIL
ncbi:MULTISPECIES: alpha/beta hydrolase [Oscillospiraceae]|uniref:alpha/beta hydrolase n=1 Tax=Clostridia TaxID=186801 RepID=UPI001107210B|nr:MULTISPECIES: alpha/beta hydrolase [Oscillospiraceae]